MSKYLMINERFDLFLSYNIHKTMLIAHTKFEPQ